MRVAFFTLGLLILSGCSFSESENGSAVFGEKEKNSGKTLFINQCADCHGIDGKLGISGAKDLSMSKLSDAEITEILHEGKGAMPAQVRLIGEPIEMDSVIQYIKTLRN